MFFGNDEKKLGNNKKNSIIKSIVNIDQTTMCFLETPKTFSSKNKKRF
jgi:hypothetical protein